MPYKDSESKKKYHKEYREKNREIIKRNCKSYYEKNKETLKIKSKERYEKTKENVIKPRISLRTKTINEFKSSKGCSVCGWNAFPQGLDLHHLYDKKFSLSQARSRDMKILEQELDKCVVVCATCHRGIHAGIVSLPDLTLIEHEHQKH